ncbi:MAG: reprolysin-like metallopeptidase [Bacteroidota bacterium]
MRLTLLCLCLGLFYSSINTQAQSVWQTIDKTTIPNSLQQDLQPNKYQLLALDLTTMRQALLQVPHESKSSLSQSNAFIELPMQDGSTQSFRLIEYDVMAPGLIAKFPEFHTYYGIEVSDPNLRVRVDITTKGVRVMGSSPAGQWFVDPYGRGNTQYYLAYAKADYPTNNSWRCELDASMVRPSGNAPVSGTRAGDCSLRVYRLAMAARGEYTAFHGGVINALSEIVNIVNRLNEIYERDLSVRFQLIPNNDLIIYPNAATDPYSGGLGQNLTQNRINLNAVIGVNNYDVGHLISASGGGGLAGLGVVCSNFKAEGGTSLPNPTGDPFVIDYVAHELGHQFGANHTFNNNCFGQRANSAAYEPGSAVTIMGYAGICSPNVQSNSDAMFHAYSMLEMQQEILSHNCPAIVNTGNQAPLVEAGSDYTIPHSTPFVLTANATDLNNDPLTYSWEQWDNEIASMPPSANSTNGPAFRTYLPSSSPSRTIPQLLSIVNNLTPTWERLSAVGRDYNFRVTVRDNAAGNGCTAEDDMAVTVHGTAGPFVVTSPNSPGTWPAGSIQPVSWNVANTDLAPINCQLVDIYLSTDGGFTYPVLLAGQVLNDGSTQVQVPNLPGNANRVRVQAHDNIFFDISNQNFTISAPTSPAIYFNMEPAYRLLCSQDSFEIQLELDEIGGAMSPVNLSATNVPAGVTLNFSSTQVNLPATVTARVVATAGVVPGNYPIILTATNNNGVIISQSFDLEISAASVATAPIIAIPGNFATNVLTEPTFIWPPAMGNGAYDLEVSSSPAFDSLVVFEEAFAGTQLVSPAKLEAGQVYYWRLRTYNECGKGPYSTVNAFQTAVTSCTEYNPGFLPIAISNSGTPTVGSLLLVPDSYVISDVNVKNIDITHDNIGELSINLSKANDADAQLFSAVCNGSTAFYNSFDDVGLAQPLACPADDSLTYQPLESFAAFDGFDAAGAWTLQISDNADGGGGLVHNWTLEICRDTLPAGPPSLLNQPLIVFQGELKTLPNTRLAASASSLTSEDVNYTLLSLPSRGDLILDNQILGLGAQFSQADIDNGLLNYQHDSTTILTDNFLFSVLDANGGWIPTETFNINVWLTDIEPELKDFVQWHLQPNPAREYVSIAIDAARSETINMRVLNLTGQSIANEQYVIQAGAPVEHRLSTQSWAAGVYLVEVSGRDWRDVKKLVVSP